MSEQRRIRNILRRLKHLKIKILIIYEQNNSQGYHREYEAKGIIKEIKRTVEYEGMINYILKFKNGKEITFDITSDVDICYYDIKWKMRFMMNNGDGTYNNVWIIDLKQKKTNKEIHKTY